MIARRVIEMDARRRCSLAKVGNPDDRVYIVTVDDAGVITMTPANVVPKSGPQSIDDDDDDPRQGIPLVGSGWVRRRRDR